MSKNTKTENTQKILNIEELQKENEFLQKELKYWKDYKNKEKMDNLKLIQEWIKNQLHENEFPLCVIEQVWDNVFSMDKFYEDFIPDVLLDKIKVEYDEWKENQDTEEEYESDSS